MGNMFIKKTPEKKNISDKINTLIMYKNNYILNFFICNYKTNFDQYDSLGVNKFRTEHSENKNKRNNQKFPNFR